MNCVHNVWSFETKWGAMWIVILFSSCLNCVMSFSFCLCWKKSNSGQEVDRIDDFVKKEQDENVNHLSTADLTNLGDNETEVTKRTTLASNTRRSLPDIPQENIWEITIDNSSEHYACVEQYSTSNERQTTSNNCGSRNSISQHSSLSQADFSPYEKVKYDQIKTKEHPYAQLKPHMSVPCENILEEGPSCYRAGTSPEDSDIMKRRVSEEPSDIPAASAVAGNIASSSEIPYMTPPTETNFSGDSQDSSKGYTSITVREPLSNILPQIATERRDLDPHYSTVSDDSDDVYTTIPDPCQEIQTGNEILDRSRLMVVEAEINQCSPQMNVDKTDSQSSSNKIEKSNNRDHQNTNGPGQESSSYFVFGDSPKPERRSAKSPLPPTPVAAVEMNRIPSTIDDLYAKVQKNKEKSTAENGGGNSSDEILENGCEYIRTNRNSEHGICPGYEVIKKKCHMDDHQSKCSNTEGSSSDIQQSMAFDNDSGPGYEVIKKKINCHTKSPSSSSSSSSTVVNNDSSPGYEVIKKGSDHPKDNFEDDVCPGYEVVRKKNYSQTADLESNLKCNESKTQMNSDVDKKKENDDANYSNTSSLSNTEYESLPGYEVIRRKVDSDGDSYKKNNYNYIESSSQYVRSILNEPVVDTSTRSPAVVADDTKEKYDEHIENQKKNCATDSINSNFNETENSNESTSISSDSNISKDDIIIEV